MPKCKKCLDTGIIVVEYRDGTEYSPCTCEEGKEWEKEFIPIREQEE